MSDGMSDGAAATSLERERARLSTATATMKDAKAQIGKIEKAIQEVLRERRGG